LNKAKTSAGPPQHDAAYQCDLFGVQRILQLEYAPEGGNHPLSIKQAAFIQELNLKQCSEPDEPAEPAKTIKIYPGPAGSLKA
jgi:hypothetical protein